MKRPRRFIKFRLLPLTIFIAFLALGLKIGEVVRDGRTLVVTLAGAAHAEAAPEAKPTGETAKDTAKPAEPAKTADEKEKPKEGEAKQAGDAASGGEGTSSEEEEKKNKREFSQIEVDLLQSLAQRRQELDNWSKQVQLKENMLIATEQRINEKIDNLQKMKKEIEKLLALYNEQEDTKIRSLVKIYENMKPKDAARIFEELDMPVLLIVVDKMSERKVSPILANMTPTKAKDLTVQLAEQRKLQKPRANEAAAAAAGTPAAATGDNAATDAAATNSSAPVNAPGSAPSGEATPAAATPPQEKPAEPAKQ